MKTLDAIAANFNVGHVNVRQSKKAASFRVADHKSLMEVIIPFFNAYPLQSQKKIDFAIFVKVVLLIDQGVHLTLDGQRMIISLLAGLNRGVPTKILEHPNFQGLDLQERPNDPFNKDQFMRVGDNWIAGFVAGDGSFDCNFGKPRTEGANPQVTVRHRVTQLSRDFALLEAICERLGSGTVALRTWGPEPGRFCDSNNSTLTTMLRDVIPFFKKHPLGTIKQLDFNDIVDIAAIMKRGGHLTPEGLAEIRRIRLGMNSFRKLPP